LEKIETGKASPIWQSGDVFEKTLERFLFLPYRGKISFVVSNIHSSDNLSAADIISRHTNNRRGLFPNNTDQYFNTAATGKRIF